MKQPDRWSELLEASPFAKPRFTHRLKQEIIRAAGNKRKARSTKNRWIAIAAIVLLVGTSWVALHFANRSFTSSSDRTPGQADHVRTEYVEDGKVLFQVFPNPGLMAGVRQGFMIQFTAPFDTFAGKTLAIDAEQKEAGTHLHVLSPLTITEPSPGYPGLERFTAQFALPLAGMWRFEVKLDDQYYGDFVLNVADPSPWTPSPTFDLPYVSADGKTHRYVLAGEEGKFGFAVGPFMNDNGEELDQQPIIARKMNKYMWYFWGNKQELTGSFEVTAVKQGAEREIGLFNASRPGLTPHNGADSGFPTSMEFPDPGIWRVNAYIDGKLFGSIYVKVADQGMTEGQAQFTKMKDKDGTIFWPSKAYTGLNLLLENELGADRFSKFVFTGDDSGRVMMMYNLAKVEQTDMLKAAQLVFSRTPELNALQIETSSQMFQTTRAKFEQYQPEELLFERVFEELEMSGATSPNPASKATTTNAALPEPVFLDESTFTGDNLEIVKLINQSIETLYKEDAAAYRALLYPKSDLARQDLSAFPFYKIKQAGFFEPIHITEQKYVFQATTILEEFRYSDDTKQNRGYVFLKGKKPGDKWLIQDID